MRFETTGWTRTKHHINHHHLPNTTSQSAAHFQRGMTALMEFAKVGMKKNKVRLCVFDWRYTFSYCSVSPTMNPPSAPKPLDPSKRPPLSTKTEPCDGRADYCQDGHELGPQGQGGWLGRSVGRWIIEWGWGGGGRTGGITITPNTTHTTLDLIHPIHIHTPQRNKPQYAMHTGPLQARAGRGALGGGGAAGRVRQGAVPG